MVYLQKACEFLVEHDIVFLSVAFVGVWCFGAANWLFDGYRKQNAKFIQCCRRATATPQFKSEYIAKLPQEYLRQWRAYVNSEAKRPSLTFEFVPHKNRPLLLLFFVLCAVVSTAYFAVFLLTGAREYAVFQAAFWLAFAVDLLVNNNLLKKKERRARRIFGSFVATLNALERKDFSHGEEDATNKTSGDGGAKSDRLERVSDLLRQSALDGCRTTQQQRKINHALNGLLQVYSKNAAERPNK